MTPRSHRRSFLHLGTRRRAVALLSAAALVAAAVPAALLLSGDGEPASATPQYPVSLDDTVSGTEAVEVLGGRDGDDLAAVAAANDLDPEGLAELLAEDDTVHVDRNGLLYVVDDFGGRGQAPAAQTPSKHQHGDDEDRTSDQLIVNAGVGSGSDAGPYAPLSQTFQLNSRPGAQRTIFIDVDGHDLTNSYWASSRPNTTAGQAAAALIRQQHSGWDPLGDGPAFSDGEKRLVQELWAQVSEDFSAFDVNVTTQDPGAAAIERANSSDQVFGTRALISDSPDLATALAEGHNVGGGGVVGLAWLGIFDDVESWTPNAPALTFSQKMRGWSIEQIAETTSHEVGHNIGLYHAWTTQNPDPDPNETDNSDLHHRLMDYESPRAASFFSEPERNLAATTYGLPLRSDEPGTNAATARSLDAGGSATATITSGSDEDWYLLDDCTSLVAKASVSDLTPNLDVAIRVVNGAGTTVAQDAPATTAGTAKRNNGVDASLSLTLDGTPHYLVVSSSGATGTVGRPYPASHSVGEYVIDVAGCTAGTAAPGVPRALAGVTDSTGSTTFTWQAPLTSGGGHSYELKVDGKRTITLPQGTTTRAVQTGTQPLTARIRAVNATGASAWAEARTEIAPRAPLHVSMRAVGAERWAVRAVLDPNAPGVHGMLRIPNSSGLFVLKDFKGTHPLYTSSAFPEGTTTSLGMTNANQALTSAYKSFVVRATPIAPTAPTSVTATSRGDAATLSWALPADDGGDFAQYQVRIDGGAWTDVSGYTFSHDFTGLAVGSHTLEVQAIHAAGNSASVPLTVTVTTAGVTASVPRNVFFTEVPGGVRVTWDLPLTTAGLPVTGWVVTAGGQTAVASPGRRDLVLTGFRADRNLTVRVAARTANGTGVEATGTLSVP